ncbi:SDR family NAD(P)-dependent oxidoreductase [Roseomonas sp. JC162]|uniref:SDR family NAD(P)-dependent oxidoreductase n=1 Tax=Neoroseomonas marina TaxID=1232220 RepID=A0A848ED20_9PROT|nr:SDR family NAD(P)-dependent oxidoreductase [Neoroseomonas marina]NMJ42464.1 SDR family NAD(P)-dependent oxidoreductase [Neoroseomonas marina]
MTSDVDVGRKRNSSRSSHEKTEPPVTDYAGIALKHLGTSAAEANLRGLARRVALMAAGESLGGRGSAARKILERGSTASEQAAEALRKVQVMTLLDALGRPAPGEAVDEAQAAIAGEHRMHRLQWLQAIVSGLDRLAPALWDSAQATPSLPRGRPKRSAALPFALEALERLWWRYHSEVPTQSTSKGGFLAFAQDVLTSEPCSFAKGSVSKAVGAFLKTENRPARKTVRAALPRPAPFRSVLVIGADDPVLREIVRLHAEDGARVVATAPPDRVAAVAKDLDARVTVVPLSLTEIPTAEDLAPLRKARYDRIVIGGLTGERGAIGPDTPAGFDQAGLADAMGAALRVPPVLNAILQGLWERLRNGGKVVVVASHLGSVSHGARSRSYTTAPAFAAVTALVRLWAHDLAGAGITVTTMHTGKGRREDGTPDRHTLPANAARVMRETVDRLGERERGSLVDINGSLEPF